MSAAGVGMGLDSTPEVGMFLGLPGTGGRVSGVGQRYHGVVWVAAGVGTAFDFE